MLNIGVHETHPCTRLSGQDPSSIRTHVAAVVCIDTAEHHPFGTHRRGCKKQALYQLKHFVMFLSLWHMGIENHAGIGEVSSRAPFLPPTAGSRGEAPQN